MKLFWDHPKMIGIQYESIVLEASEMVRQLLDFFQPKNLRPRKERWISL